MITCVDTEYRKPNAPGKTILKEFSEELSSISKKSDLNAFEMKNECLESVKKYEPKLERAAPGLSNKLCHAFNLLVKYMFGTDNYIKNVEKKGVTHDEDFKNQKRELLEVKTAAHVDIREKFGYPPLKK